MKPAHIEAPAGAAPVIAVTSGKGGVGKTTTAVALATRLGRDGLNVVLVDADTETPNTHLVAGIADDQLKLRAVDVATWKVAAPANRNGTRLLSPLCSVNSRPACVDDLLGIVDVLDDVDVVVVDCAPGWTDSHVHVAAVRPVWLVAVNDTASALADHRNHLDSIARHTVAVNDKVRNRDRRRKLDLDDTPKVGVVRTGGTPMLSVDPLPAGYTGDVVADIGNAASFDELVDSDQMGALAEWVRGQIAGDS